MKKTWKNYAFYSVVLMFGLIIGVFWRDVAEIVWPPNVAVWQKTVRSHLILRAEKFTSEELEKVYAEAILDQELREIKPSPKQDVATIKKWVNQYAANDMEPFIRKVIERVPKDIRKNILIRAINENLPNILFKYEPRVAGETNRLDTIWLNSALIDSYDQLRATLSHELVHYWIQGTGFDNSLEFEVGEGVTEYLTIQAFEKLAWKLDFLSLGDRGQNKNKRPESSDKNLKDIELSLQIREKQSRSYPVQTYALSILMCLDSEDKILEWYLGKKLDDFHLRDYLEQLLNRRKIDNEDARAWIDIFTSLEDLDQKADEQWVASVRISDKKGELSKRYEIFLNYHFGSQLPTLEIAKDFERILLLLEERNFEPMLLDEWDVLITRSRKHLREQIERFTSQREHRFEFYYDRILAILKIVIFDDIDLCSEDPLAESFFSDIKKDSPRREIVAAVSQKIRIALSVEASRSLEWIKTEHYKLETKDFDALREEIGSLEKELDRNLEVTAASLKTTTQHHMRLVELLRNAGTDPLPLFKQRGMPQYFLNQFK